MKPAQILALMGAFGVGMPAIKLPEEKESNPERQLKAEMKRKRRQMKRLGVPYESSH